MKVYKKIEYQTSYNKLEKIICDVCKAETTHEWKKNDGDAIEIKIHKRDGFIYRIVDGYDHDEGEGTQIHIDLCPTCFDSQFVPWIQMQGGNVHTERWNF